MLLIVSNIPTPYRIPLFNAIYKALLAQRKQCLVVFSTPSHAFRNWKINETEFEFKYHYLNTASTNSNENTRFSYKGLLTTIRTQKPSVVVVPGFSIAVVIAVIGKLFTPYKLVIWSGTTNNPNRKVSVLKVMFRKIVAQFANEYVVYGTAAKEYVLSLNASAKINIAYNTVNVEKYYLDKLVVNYAPCQLLYVGNFTKGKQVHTLIAIADKLRVLNINFHLTLIGSGETFNDIKNEIYNQNLNQYVTLKSHLQKIDLIPEYHKAQVFLFPSNYDIWGLVVNEAMAAGLCVFSSIKAGATRDLIRNNETGFAVDFDNPNEVVTLIKQLLDSPDNFTKIRTQGQEYLLQNISIDKACKVFTELLD
ncbi:MAG: glycosyltransferase [Bacteroidia bacterium]|nr:glycosyltransferase [Bacteroidia bacterium]